MNVISSEVCNGYIALVKLECLYLDSYPFGKTTPTGTWSCVRSARALGDPWVRTGERRGMGVASPQSNG